MRVCDALLFRRGLPLYPVPGAGQTPQGWAQWIGVGFELFDALSGLGIYRPDGEPGRIEPVGSAAVRFGRLCETYPDAIFCGLLGHRPSPKRTPWGLQQRIAALRLQGRPGRRRRALAPHARRARRVRRRLRRLRAGRRPGAAGSAPPRRA